MDMQTYLVAGYKSVIDDPKSTPADKLAAMEKLQALVPQAPAGIVTPEGEKVSSTPARSAVREAGEASGEPVASDAPTVPQPATPRERAAVRMGRGTRA